jgi:hypothetical protein
MIADTPCHVPKMCRVLGVVNHSFGWSGLGVEHTTAAFGGPGKQHETAKEKAYRRQSDVSQDRNQRGYDGDAVVASCRVAPKGVVHPSRGYRCGHE